ncbi:hypothetical protein HQ533_04285 [Candidatus Woesearchaeota archaeon]|nr:hypothetical protein [Candidatus Woesearchaeota archaeon]
MEEDLRAIGLSKNEAKIYLALAELGSCSIGNIAKKIKIHRTNVYDAIEGLVKKGLASHIIKEKVKYFQITGPDNLLNMVKEKEAKVQAILPRLDLLNDMSIKNEAQILEGLQAAKRVMDNFLSYKDTILVMGVSSNVADLMGYFLTHYHTRRIKEKIMMKHIYNTDAHKRIKDLKNMKYTEVRILPSEYDSPVATNIVGDEVTLIHWAKSPVIIRIKNKKIADSYKKYFDMLWNNAKPA